MQKRWHFSTCHCLPFVKVEQTGYATVYVGVGRRRFEIPARYFNLPVIADLLVIAEEEFGGAQPAGGLSLLCEPVFFQWILDQLADDEPKVLDLGLPAFRELFANLVEAVDSS